MESKNKIAIVTGASSPKDIGTAICRRFASQGIDIFFTHWKSEQDWIEEFQLEMVNMGVRNESLNIDLSEVNAAMEILHSVENKLDLHLSLSIMPLIQRMMDIWFWMLIH